MTDIDRGVLAGVKITEEEAETVEKLADKMRELDNGVLDPEEAALGDMMGAGSSVKQEIEEGAEVKIGNGTQTADHGVLTGVSISPEKEEEISRVAETIEDIEAYEKHEGAAAKDIADKGDALASAMGVDK